MEQIIYDEAIGYENFDWDTQSKELRDYLDNNQVRISYGDPNNIRGNL